MALLNLKYLSQSVLINNSIIRKSNLVFRMKRNLLDLKHSAFSKNKLRFEDIKKTIESYLSKTRNRIGLKFDEITLWQIADNRHQFNTLEFLIENDIKILNLFEDIHDIINLAKKSGAEKVISLLLNEENTKILNKRIGSVGIMKIGIHDGSKYVLKQLLNPDKFKLLRTYFSVDEIIKIASHDGAKQILDMIIMEKDFKVLLEQIGKTGFLKISNHDGAKQVFNLLLDKEKFAILKENLGSFLVQVASRSGARQCLNLITDKNIYPVLLERLGKSELINIATNGGSAQVFYIILDTPRYTQLTTMLGEKAFLQIASHDGSKQVFDILLIDGNFEQLLQLLDKPDLIKIANRNGARQVLDLFLDTYSYTTLVERLGKAELIKISCTTGARQVLDLILNDDTYITLINRIGRLGLINICKKNGSKQVLSLLLNNQNFEKLKNYFGESSLISIAANSGSKQVFDIILNDKNLQTLLNRIEKVWLTKICQTEGGATMLKIILNKDLWGILKRIFDEEKLKKLTCHKNFRMSLMNMISNYKPLSQYFSTESLYKYSLINNRNQNGLKISYLKDLSCLYKFTENEILTLTQLTGRHFPHIFTLLQTYESKILSLFEELNRLPLIAWPLSTQISNHENNTPTQYSYEKKYNFLLLAELNHFCIDYPLSLEELFFLKTTFSSTHPVQKRWFRIKQLLSVTGVYHPSERKRLCRILMSRNHSDFNFCIKRLYVLPPTLRKWFIEKGEIYLQFLLNPKSSFTEDDDNIYTPRDQEQFMLCLRDKTMRNYITHSYKKELQYVTDTAIPFSILEDCPQKSIIFTEPSILIRPIDWLNITLDLYNQIDSNLEIMDCLGDDAFVIEYNILTPKELKNLNKNYPTVTIKDNRILINVKKEFLERIIQTKPENIEIDTYLLHKNSRKRCKLSSAVPPAKKRLVNTVDSIAALENFSKPVSEIAWTVIEKNLRGNNYRLIQKIIKALKFRSDDEVPNSIKDLIPILYTKNSEMLTDLNTDDRCQHEFLPIINHIDWDRILD